MRLFGLNRTADYSRTSLSERVMLKTPHPHDPSDSPMVRPRAEGAQSRGVTLLNPDGIATADCAAPHDGGIHTDVDPVMLGRRAQDSRIFR